LLIVLDLSRANLPWIVHWDYLQKYATNDVIELLRQKPHEHRVAGLPFLGAQPATLLDSLYRVEWAQHHFSYYNIQSLDSVQMPSLPENLSAFETALRPEGPNALFGMARRWQLTNTRYLLGPASALDRLNAGFSPVEPRFRIAKSFDILPKQGVAKPATLEDCTAAFNSAGTGQYAIFELMDALPRARLYSHWQVMTNDEAALAQLPSPGFDPTKTVLVNSALPGPLSIESATPGAAGEGTVEFADYDSTHIVLKTRADFASILLLNDRFDPAWKVTVDGQPTPSLRCNYVMRGARIAAGVHTVEFTFQIALGLPFARVQVEPDTQLVEIVFKVPTGLPSYMTLVGFGLGLALICLLIFSSGRNDDSRQKG